MLIFIFVGFFSLNAENVGFLYSVNNEVDNISKYYIIYNGIKYKIKSVRENWLDIEAIGKYEEEIPSI